MSASVQSLDNALVVLCRPNLGDKAGGAARWSYSDKAPRGSTCRFRGVPGEVILATKIAASTLGSSLAPAGYVVRFFTEMRCRRPEP